MARIKFPKEYQRKFLKEVLGKLNCPSLRALNQFGFEINYSTLKNYFLEERLLPEEFFRDLCYLAKMNVGELDFEVLEDSWGQVKGGKVLRN
jgi:hypothetical protein